MLPPKLRDAFDLLSELVLIATAIAVTVFAWPVITQLAAFDERSQAANFPLVIPQAMVPIGYRPDGAAGGGAAHRQVGGAATGGAGGADTPH